MPAQEHDLKNCRWLCDFLRESFAGSSINGREMDKVRASLEEVVADAERNSRTAKTNPMGREG